MAEQIVHVLFNGFFFMEFQTDQSGKNKLIGLTPGVFHGGVSAHDHLLGIPNNRVPWRADVDLSTVLIGDDTKHDFPDAIPRFSGSKTGVGGIHSIAGALTVALPRPIGIFPLRIGKFVDFPGQPGTVFNDMKGRTKGDFSLVTCLRYKLPDANRGEWPGGDENKCHFYSEPHCDISTHHLFTALGQCHGIFSKPQAFDLTVDPMARRKAIPAVDPRLGFGLAAIDEQALAELNGCAPGTNPANCGQYAVIP